MFRNYIKVAFRNLWKNKGYSAINVIGLAVGLATCLLILLWVWDEKSYDSFHSRASRIYRVHTDIKFGGSEMRMTTTSDMMGSTLLKDIPEIETFTRIYSSMGPQLVKTSDAFVLETAIAYVDSTFFRVFDFVAKAGDLQNALNEPNTAVISEKAAIKFFGKLDVIGKVLQLKSHASGFKIAGLIQDMPSNSHFHYDVLLSMDNVDYPWGNYLSHNFQTYLLLREGVRPDAVSGKFRTYMEKYIIPQAQGFMQVRNIEEFEKSGNKLAYTLMPIRDIHLKSDRFPELDANGNEQNVVIFTIVALFILLIACINFMNLSTARSANRAREVGIRKVLGTERKGLMTQFLLESGMVAFLAMLLALALATLAMPFFNDLSSKQLSVADAFRPSFLPVILLLPLMVGLLAGSYPAFYLSSFKPITVLKGKLSSGFRKSRFRSTLVVLQFAATIFLIVATIVVYNQLNYIQNTRVGFNKDQVLVLDNTYVLEDRARVFKQEMLKVPGVSSVTLSSFLPVESSSRSDNTYSRTAVMDMDNSFNMQTWEVDEDYLQTLGMELSAGRNFSREFTSDSNAVIINEATAAILGYKDPIGKTLYYGGNPPNLEPLLIIGVVKNFNFESLKQKVAPLCMRLINNTGSVALRIQTRDLQKLIKTTENTFRALAPGMPFSYRFLDDSFDQMYRTEQRVGKLAIAFSLLAIIVACMGLFGLATYAAEQRIKEIGIRKVLGASATTIVEMLSRDFLILVLLACFISIPLAWWAMNTWLMNFAFRIDIQWWFFAVAALLALVVALVTVSMQSLRAAMMNPVKSLRTE